MIKKLENYIQRCCTFDFAKNKSEEFYFGENNPLKNRLISNITRMREIANDTISKNKLAKPIDVITSVKPVVNELKQIIIEEFNIEGCSVGWWNDLNAACYPQIANAELYGKSDNANDLNKRLNDIITSDAKGFHYKNKKGIYYCIILGYNIFINDIFTVEEAAAVLVHELGHAMQHIVTSVNQTASLAQFQYLLNVSDYIPYLSPTDREYVLSYLKRYREARKRNDKDEMDKLGKELMESIEPDKNSMFFSKTTDDDLTDNTQSNWYSDNSKDYKQRIEGKKKPGFFAKIFGTIGSLFSVVFSPFYLLGLKSKSNILNDKSNEIHACKMFEEAADNFSAIYGLGPQQAACMKKFETLKSSYNRTVPKILERIPLFDLYASMKELNSDYLACSAGYPTNKQRALNLYKAAEFEIKNNKELSDDAKKELQNQIDKYKEIYDEFVKADNSKGFFYKLYSKFKRESIEEAAKRDNLVNEHVLVPLQQKADPNFDPDKV